MEADDYAEIQFDRFERDVVAVAPETALAFVVREMALQEPAFEEFAETAREILGFHDAGFLPFWNSFQSLVTRGLLRSPRRTR